MKILSGFVFLVIAFFSQNTMATPAYENATRP